MSLAILFWAFTLAAPIQDGVVVTQHPGPRYAEASALVEPATATNAYQRQDCVFGGQPVACPEPPPPAVAQDTSDEDEAIIAWTTQRDEAAASEEGDVPRRCFFGRRRIAAQGCPPMPPVDPAKAEYRRTRFEEPDRHQEPAPIPPPNHGCRTETVRSPDGASVSTSITCGSGDTRMLDQMLDSLGERSEPPTCAMPAQGEDRQGFLDRCGGNPR